MKWNVWDEKNYWKFNRRLNDKEIISELEDRSAEIIQFEEQKKIKI